MGIKPSSQQNTRSFFSWFLPRKHHTPMESKENPMWAGSILYSDSPQPISMPKNYKAFVRDGYKEIDTLYKCISYITRNAAAIRPKLYTDDTMQKEIERHPLLDLLKKPNAEQSGVAYREAAIGFKLISGDSFQWSLRPTRTGIPAELWPLRPDLVDVLVVRNQGIVGYKYEHLKDPILPENIGHTKYWNPDDDDAPGRGMSPIEAAALTAQMLRDGKRWNLSRLQNDARPPGAWTTPGFMDANSLRELEKALNKKFSGKNNAGRIPVLHSGLKWESMGLSPAEMDYLDMIKYSGGSVANIFNIPPQLIGDTSSTTYDNMEQAKMASYTEAIFPELDDLYAEWNVWLLPMYSDLASSGAYLSYDKESVEVIQKVIQEQKNAQADRAAKMWIGGLITQNEAREMADMPAHPQGNIYRIGKDLVAADRLMDLAEKSVKEPEPLPMLLQDPTKPGNENPQENNDDPQPKRFVIPDIKADEEDNDFSLNNGDSDEDESVLRVLCPVRTNKAKGNGHKTRDEYRNYMKEVLI